MPDDDGAGSDSSDSCVLDVPVFDESDAGSSDEGPEDLAWAAALEEPSDIDIPESALPALLLEAHGAPAMQALEDSAYARKQWGFEPVLMRLAACPWDRTTLDDCSRVPVNVEGSRGSADKQLATFLAYASHTTPSTVSCVVVEKRWESPRDVLRMSLPGLSTFLDDDLRTRLPVELRPGDELELSILPAFSARCPEHGPPALTVGCLALAGCIRWALFAPGVKPSSVSSTGATAWWFKGPAASIEFLQQPGELLVIPPGWSWVKLSGPELSVSICVPALLMQTASWVLPELAQSGSPRRAEALAKALAACRPDLASAALFFTPPEPPARIESVLDATYALQRIPASQMTVTQFRQHVIPGSNPVILNGLNLTSTESLGLALEFLRCQLPSTLVAPIKVDGHTVDDVPMDRFFSALDEGKDVYLADISFADYFPWLFEHFKVPRYALHCFSHRTMRSNFAANKTPALFVGSANSRTALHIDQLSTNFWMYLCEGRKEWSVFHPEDVAYLSPEFDVAEQIHRFSSLKDLAANPHTSKQLDQARRIDFVLEPGELVFIPQGTPHEVMNLSQAVAVSGNFFDQSNLSRSLELMEQKLAHSPAGRRHDNLTNLHDALEEIEWPSLEEDLAPEDSTARMDMGALFPAHEKLVSLRPMHFSKDSH